MNGIIHVCSHPEDENPHFRITEEKIFADIFHYIEVRLLVSLCEILFLCLFHWLLEKNLQCVEMMTRSFCTHTFYYVFCMCTFVCGRCCFE